MTFTGTKQLKKPSVGIVGGGIGGLSLGARLSKHGYNVTILEKNEYFGGKAGEIFIKTKKGDFRFDSGPSLVSVPEEFDNFYKEFGLDYEKELELEKLDITTRHFFDGCVIDSYSDDDKFANEIELKTKDTRKSVIKFLAHTKRLYQTSKVYLQHPISGKIIFTLDFWKALLFYLKIPIFLSINQDLKHFFKDPKTLRIFNRLATFNGSNPYLTPMILNSLANVVHGQDTFYPKNGIISIPKSIENLCKAYGVTMFNNFGVNKIIRENNKWKVFSKSKTLEFDILVNNLDSNIFYSLIDPGAKKYKFNELSTSAILMYLAIDASFNELEIHNGIYKDDYKNEYELISKGKLSDAPSIYLHVSSNVTPTDAPSGCQSWFVVINTPSYLDQDFDQMGQDVYNYFIKTISEILKTDISSKVLNKVILTPKIIEKETSAYKGSIYGKNMNNLLRIITRQNNYDKKYKNLYHVGGTAHPGGGMPMVLASSRIVSNLIFKKYGK